MVFNRPFPFHPSYKIHILIGLILGGLLGFILTVLQPLNINNFEAEYKTLLFMGFGFLKFINYVLAHLVSLLFYRKKKRWSWWNEIVFIILASLSDALLGYIYLETALENRPLSFLRLTLFFFYIILPFLPVLFLPKLALRYWFSLKAEGQDEEHSTDENMGVVQNKITIRGNNANEELHLYREQLLFVKSVDNYVMIFYCEGQTKSKMLRSKLSGISEQVPFLIQPHRSYLVSPDQDFKINGNSQKAFLHHPNLKEEIPIARASYKAMKAVFN